MLAVARVAEAGGGARREIFTTTESRSTVS
jgi:hypothetical protein